MGRLIKEFKSDLGMIFSPKSPLIRSPEEKKRMCRLGHYSRVLAILIGILCLFSPKTIVFSIVIALFVFLSVIGSAYDGCC